MLLHSHPTGRDIQTQSLTAGNEANSHDVQGKMKVSSLNDKTITPEHHLSIDDKYQRACAPENHLVIEGGVEKVHLPRKVPYVKVDEGTAGDVVLVDLVGAFQEKRLIGRHLMKHHLRFKTLNHRRIWTYRY